MSGETPKWWKNPNFVDANQLYSEPDYLNTISDKIDCSVNEIAPVKNMPPEKPVLS